MAGQIGHNNPPTPFEEIRCEIQGLREEASHWLDGNEVKTQAEADAIHKLLNLTRDAKKKADALRKEELKPHDDSKSEIQSRYNELIGKNKSVTGLAILIENGCRNALTPFIQEQERIREEAARAAKEEAERKQRQAQEMAASSSIDDQEEALRISDEALKKQKEGDKIAKSKTQVKGHGRASSLRTSYHPEIKDPREAVRHYWSKNRSAFIELVCTLAAQDVRSGSRQIPGFEILEKRTVV
jgi:type II secretory pathway component HofQ